MIPPEEAWSRLEPHLTPLDPRPVPRAEAFDLVLAEPLAATSDIPFADLSAMDGYAYAGDVEPGTRLPVSGRIAAGNPPDRSLTPGRAVKIMTGAAIPSGADRVVPVEDTDGGDRQVTIETPADSGANIRRAGEVHHAGEKILPAGSVLHPGTLALAASHGHRRVSVHRPPDLAYLVTGDEVVPPEEAPAPGQIRDSHGDFLRAAAARLGLEARSLGIAPDRRGALVQLVGRGLHHDVLIVTGGVSMGELDFVEEVLVEHGCELLFEKVAVKPGKPLVAAVHDGGLVFGLPGNPASVMVTFRLFVQPSLRRLMGHEDGFWKRAVGARLAAPLPGAKSRDVFLPAAIDLREGELLATPLISRGSHDLRGHALGSALVRIPAGSGAREPGDACEVLLPSW
ncbi:MAG: molybdopterin molybdotransferase MoeA [Thermoanaerobaculia bacterium]|nr:molybdopterin molybdotransferase MoeA [Thermoanaerobaculia bacterium]